MKTILIVEDDENILRLEKDFLEINGYNVLTEQTGDYDTIANLSLKSDLILLDLMLPKNNGHDLCRKLRENIDIPILIISALSQDTDVILGLGFGADDYITKPFNPHQLVARIKSHLSRYDRLTAKENKIENIIEHEDMLINIDEKTCVVKGVSLTFTNKEFEILCLLAKNKNKVLTKNQIYEAVWKEHAFGDASTITVHVKRIREKLNLANPNIEYISTIWGVGYKFVSIYK